MKKQLLSAALVSAAVSLTHQASAGLDDIIWVPQVGIQIKQLEFKQKFSGPLVDSGSFDADLPSAAISLTALHNKFYASLKYEGSFGDTSTYSDITFTNSDSRVERDDFSFTVGYKIWSNLNIFAGYMEGETTLKPSPVCPTNPAAVDLGQGGCVTSSGVVGVANFAYSAQINGGPTYEQTYKEDGFYFGGGYGWRIAETGTLSLSAAYAKLDTIYQDNFLHAGAARGKFTGDADGFSLGINWSAPLTETFGYYLDIRSQQYKMDSEDSTGYWSGVSVKTEENITAFTAGIQWYL
jgi:hypothetical protein